MNRTTALVLAAALAATAPASALTTIYANDFDNPAVVAGGVTASLVGGADVPAIAPYDATYGNLRRNDTVNPPAPTQLVLSNLPAHTTVDLDFTLAFLDSWDSTDGGGGVSPDRADLYLDGNLVASYTYNNALGSVKDFDGGALLYEYVQFDGNGFYSDTVVDMSGDPALVFPHSASTLTFEWIASGDGWQGNADEAIGLDNLRVSVDGVPEPATCGLALAALLAYASRRRRAARA